MIQTYDQIQDQANKINGTFEGTVFIQKVYSTSYFICFTVRCVGITHYLYLGRGAGYEGIWISDKKPESFLRKRDAFLEYLRKFTSATQFVSIEIDEKDRIISLNYMKWRQKNALKFFYKGRKLYFANYHYDSKQDCMKLFRSWTLENTDYPNDSFDYFDEVGRKELAEKNKNPAEPPKFSIDQLLAKELKDAQHTKEKKKSKKFNIRKRDRIMADLAVVNKWEVLQKIAFDTEDFTLYPQKCIVDGFKLRFKESEHFKRRDEVFSKVKKLKRAQGFLEIRLKDVLAACAGLVETSDVNQVPITKPYWHQKKQDPNKPAHIPSTGGYKIFTFPGFEMGVGLTAIGNDELRRNWAKKDDIWFHLDQVKSPHIIIKNNKVLDEETLKLIGSVMIDYSAFDFSEANLVYTQVKYLKGVKGAAGKVIIKKEKRVKVYCVDNWRSLLLDS